MPSPSGIVRPLLRLLIVAIAAPALLTGPPAAAQTTAEEHEARRLEALWRGQWRRFADEYFLYDGQAHVLLNYERGAKSSLPYSRSKLEKPSFSMSWKQRIGQTYVVKTKELSPDNDDVAYALNVLPRLSVGHFGHIVSARVSRRIDDQTVEVADIQFIDDDALARDKADSLTAVQRQTRGIGPSLNVTADQINDFMFMYRSAIAKLPSKPLTITGLASDQVDAAGQVSGPLQLALFDRGNGLEAVPLESVKVGLDEEQFIAMLESRGKSKEEFALVIAEALDRKLSTAKRERAIRRYLEDYNPKDVAAHLARAEQAAKQPPVAQAEPKTPEAPDTPDTAPEAPAEPALAAAEPALAAAEPEPEPGDSDPDPEPVSTVATADPRSHATKPKKPNTDAYFEDLGEDDEPDTNTSIFDFGRDF